MMRKRKIIGIIGLVLILVIVLFYVVRIRPMVTEYKKIAYDKLANIDEDTFAKLENTRFGERDQTLPKGDRDQQQEIKRPSYGQGGTGTFRP